MAALSGVRYGYLDLFSSIKSKNAASKLPKSLIKVILVSPYMEYKNWLGGGATLITLAGSHPLHYFPMPA